MNTSEHSQSGAKEKTRFRPRRRVTQRRTYFSSARGMPTERGVPSVRPGPSRRQAHPTLRRRLQMRLARIPHQVASFRRSPRMLSLMLLCACTALLLLFANGDWFYVPGVAVDGNAVIATDDISAASAVTNYNIFFVRFGDVDQRLRALPGLKSARSWYEWPNVVHVSVVERTPLVMWESNKHTSWVDETGQIFNSLRTPANAMTVADLDNQTRVSIDPHLITALKAIGSALPTLKRLEYSDAKGLAYTDERGWRVLLGQPAEINAKLAMVQSLSAYIVTQKIDAEYLDVRLPERAFYKPK
jgi:cell division septal protein FtsQ